MIFENDFRNCFQNSRKISWNIWLSFHQLAIFIPSKYNPGAHRVCQNRRRIKTESVISASLDLDFRRHNTTTTPKIHDFDTYVKDHAFSYDVTSVSQSNLSRKTIIKKKLSWKKARHHPLCLVKQTFLSIFNIRPCMELKPLSWKTNSRLHVIFDTTVSDDIRVSAVTISLT